MLKAVYVQITETSSCYWSHDSCQGEVDTEVICHCRATKCTEGTRLGDNCLTIHQSNNNNNGTPDLLIAVERLREESEDESTFKSQKRKNKREKTKKQFLCSPRLWMFTPPEAPGSAKNCLLQSESPNGERSYVSFSGLIGEPSFRLSVWGCVGPVMFWKKLTNYISAHVLACISHRGGRWQATCLLWWFCDCD